MAEHTYFPRAFTVGTTQSPSANGPVNVQVITTQDVGGDVVKLMFGMDDWAQFQKAVADPEGFAAEQREQARAKEARSRIVLARQPLGAQPGAKREH